jgi:WD40 repeat protein/DNA-binding XRE family transcriptional regulator
MRRIIVMLVRISAMPANLGGAMPGQQLPLGLERFTGFGDLLKFLRRRAGLTQRELSIAVGYSHAQISRLELGQRNPDLATIAARFVPVLHLEKEPGVAERLLELASVAEEVSQVAGLPPFRGLRFFDESDADLFFGRETITDGLLDRMLTCLSGSSPHRFMAVVGASGSGKSSFVRAGLIPAIRRSPSTADWESITLTPTVRPLQALAVALTPEAGSLSAATTLIDDMQRDRRALLLGAERFLHVEGPRPSRGADRRTRGRAPHASRQLLLLIDQFEELFTLCRDEGDRRAYIDNLMTATADPGGSLFVVIALRADFYPHCAPYAELREALATQQTYLGPMSIDEMRRAIEEPARRGNWELEPGLVDILLSDVSSARGQSPEPGALPLLSHALLETWQRRSGRTLTVSGYLATGGVQGAIAETADDVFRDQLDLQQQTIARNIFLRLTQLGEEDATRETRRRATLGELIPAPEEATSVQAVLTCLADARLITIDNGVVEVAHEALIREWPMLRGWLDEDRDGLRLHRHLTVAAEGWERRDRDPGECYRGTRLAQTLGWAATHLGALNASEQAFLEASRLLVEREDAEREAQRQRQLETAQALAETQGRAAMDLRRRALYLFGAFILALVMAGVALFQGEQARRSAVTAQHESQIANVRELAAASLSNLPIDPERSVLLAMQAVLTTRTVDGTVLPEAEEALHRSIMASHVVLTLAGHTTPVIGVAYSPDGRRLATIGKDGTVKVWEASTGQELFNLPGTTPLVDTYGPQRLGFSPDGALLASSDKNLVKIWDSVSGKVLRTLSGHTAEVWAVAFSRDGKRLATGGVDSMVQVWEVATGKLLVTLSGHTDAIELLAFSPDGIRLASASDDGTVRVWDSVAGELLREFAVPPISVAFSPDGTRLAVSDPEGVRVLDAISGEDVLTIQVGTGFFVFSPDWTRLVTGGGGTDAKVWDARTGQELLTLYGHTQQLMDAVFSPDGVHLATVSFDQTARVWDITPDREVVTLPDADRAVAFSPDGTELATGGTDGSVRLWSAATGEELRTLPGHSDAVWGVAFSPDGKHLATASADTTARVWDLATGMPQFDLLGHSNLVRDIAYGPDGNRIATASFDQSARVWDAATGQELFSLAGHPGLVTGVAFSPDGRLLATSGSQDASVIIWDAVTGESLLTLLGHAATIADLAFSPDGTRLATASWDATAKIWDAITGVEMLTLSGHQASLQALAFSPDGRFLATGSKDTTVKIWEVATGQELQTLFGAAGEITNVAFRPPDGAHLAVASGDGMVRVYVLPMEDLLALARSRVTRSLTQEECRKYLHVDQCPASDS